MLPASSFCKDSESVTMEFKWKQKIQNLIQRRQLPEIPKISKGVIGDQKKRNVSFDEIVYVVKLDDNLQPIPHDPPEKFICRLKIDANGKRQLVPRRSKSHPLPSTTLRLEEQRENRRLVTERKSRRRFRRGDQSQLPDNTGFQDSEVNIDHGPDAVGEGSLSLQNVVNDHFIEETSNKYHSKSKKDKVESLPPVLPQTSKKKDDKVNNSEKKFFEEFHLHYYPLHGLKTLRSVCNSPLSHEISPNSGNQHDSLEGNISTDELEDICASPSPIKYHSRSENNKFLPRRRNSDDSRLDQSSTRGFEKRNETCTSSSPHKYRPRSENNNYPQRRNSSDDPQLDHSPLRELEERYNTCTLSSPRRNRPRSENSRYLPRSSDDPQLETYSLRGVEELDDNCTLPSPHTYRPKSENNKYPPRNSDDPYLLSGIEELDDRCTLPLPYKYHPWFENSKYPRRRRSSEDRFDSYSQRGLEEFKYTLPLPYKFSARSENNKYPRRIRSSDDPQLDRFPLSGLEESYGDSKAKLQHEYVTISDFFPQNDQISENFPYIDPACGDREEILLQLDSMNPGDEYQLPASLEHNVASTSDSVDEIEEQRIITEFCNLMKKSTNLCHHVRY